MRRIGAIGGRIKSAAKMRAAISNARLGGRNRKIYIYGMVNLNTGRIEYVGQSRDPKARFNAHACVTGKFHRKQRPGKFKAIQFPIGLAILCVTTEAHANAVERLFYDHYKSFGQCRMNGEKFRGYYMREPEFLGDDLDVQFV